MSRLGTSSGYADLVAEVALEDQRMVIAQVQVHSSMRSTPYWRFVQKDPSVILRALSAFLELGVLIIPRLHLRRYKHCLASGDLAFDEVLMNSHCKW